MNPTAVISFVSTALLLLRLQDSQAAGPGCSSSSTGQFAVVRRCDDRGENSRRADSVPRCHRRGSIRDCDYANYNDSGLPSDGTDLVGERKTPPPFTSRFAVEYQHERSAIRSAENAHAHRRRRTREEEHETHEHASQEAIHSAFRIEGGASSRSRFATSRDQPRPAITFVHETIDPIFV